MAMRIGGTLRVLMGVSLAGLTSLPLRAQVCAGLLSLHERPVVVSVDAAAARGASSVGAGLTAGRSAFAGAFVERAVYRNVDYAATQADTRSTNVGAAVGYEVRRERFAVCPVATVQWESGPDGTFAGNILNSDGWTIGAGVSVGAVLIEAAGWRVISSTSLTVQRASTTVHDFPFVGTDSRAHDTGLLYGFAIGLVVGARLTIQPTVNIPSGIEGGETTYGLSVNLGLGR